jgi:hypothetical protein
VVGDSRGSGLSLNFNDWDISLNNFSGIDEAVNARERFPAKRSASANEVLMKLANTII